MVLRDTFIRVFRPDLAALRSKTDVSAPPAPLSPFCQSNHRDTMGQIDIVFHEIIKRDGCRRPLTLKNHLRHLQGAQGSRTG